MNFITIIDKEVKEIKRDNTGKIREIEINIDVIDCITDDLFFEEVTITVDDKLNIIKKELLHNMVMEHFEFFEVFLKENKLKLITGGVI